MEDRGPTLLIDDTVLVTGQVERVTDFEPGFPIQYRRAEHDTWVPDFMVWDDQGIVVEVKNKGLVVLSSCSHAGVINVLSNAQRLTGAKLHAFVGGCHLPGAIMEPVIPRTLQEMGAMKLDFIVPGHCTGWKATYQIAHMFPDGFVPSSVGTVLRF